jgi:hypothetical protein
MSIRCKPQDPLDAVDRKWQYLTIVIPASAATAKSGAVLSLCEVVALPPDAPQSLGSQRDKFSDTQKACRHHHCIGCDPACERCGSHGCKKCIDSGRAFQLRAESEWAKHSPCQFML